MELECGISLEIMCSELTLSLLLVITLSLEEVEPGTTEEAPLLVLQPTTKAVVNRSTGIIVFVVFFIIIAFL